jgi:hypothetical protein
MEELKITKENAQKAYDNGCADVKKVLKNLLGDVFEQKTVMVGHKFKMADVEFMIVSVEPGKIAIIDLTNGTRLTSAHKVEDCNKIKREDLEKYYNNNSLDHIFR